MLFLKYLDKKIHTITGAINIINIGKNKFGKVRASTVDKSVDWEGGIQKQFLIKK